MVRPGVTTKRARRGGREVHPLAGRGPVVQGLPRLPGLDLRVAEPHGRPRHPGPVRAQKGDVISIDIGVTLDGWVADAARTYAIGAGHPGRREAAEVTEESLFEAVEQCRVGNRLGAVSNAVQTARRVRRAEPSCARSSATASAATCTRTRRSRTSARSSSGPSSRRAWSSPSSRWSPPAATPCGWATTTGRSTPGRLARRPLRVHHRRHRRRPPDPHALARAGRGRGRLTPS